MWIGDSELTGLRPGSGGQTRYAGFMCVNLLFLEREDPSSSFVRS